MVGSQNSIMCTLTTKKKIQPKKISTSAGAYKSLLILGSLLKREEEKKYNQRKYQNRREPINPY
jgi:hypothetical protein